MNYRLVVSTAESPVIASIHTARGIVYGTPQTSQITPDVYQGWVFYGRAGSRIKAEVLPASGDFTPILYLVGPEGHILFVDRALNAGHPARLPGFVLVQEGFYGLVVSGTVSALAEYTISLEFLASGAVPQGVLNDTSVGELSASVPVHQWMVAPRYSGHYRIEIESQSPDEPPTLMVLSADGTPLRDEKSGDTGLGLYLERGHNYAVVVSAGVSVANSQYVLRILPSTVVANGGILGLGEPNIGRISDTHTTDEWIILSSISGELAIRVERVLGSITPVVALFDENGILLRQVTANEDGVVDAVIDVPAEGYYTVQVSRLRSSTSGDYTILANLGS
jgi:hypothetical protein